MPSTTLSTSTLPNMEDVDVDCDVYSLSTLSTTDDHELRSREGSTTVTEIEQGEEIQDIDYQEEEQDDGHSHHHRLLVDEEDSFYNRQDKTEGEDASSQSPSPEDDVDMDNSQYNIRREFLRQLSLDVSLAHDSEEYNSPWRRNVATRNRNFFLSSTLFITVVLASVAVLLTWTMGGWENDGTAASEARNVASREKDSTTGSVSSTNTTLAQEEEYQVHPQPPRAPSDLSTLCNLFDGPASEKGGGDLTACNDICSNAFCCQSTCFSHENCPAYDPCWEGIGQRGDIFFDDVLYDEQSSSSSTGQPTIHDDDSFLVEDNSYAATSVLPPAPSSLVVMCGVGGNTTSCINACEAAYCCYSTCYDDVRCPTYNTCWSPPTSSSTSSLSSSNSSNVEAESNVTSSDKVELAVDLFVNETCSNTSLSTQDGLLQCEEMCFERLCCFVDQGEVAEHQWNASHAHRRRRRRRRRNRLLAEPIPSNNCYDDNAEWCDAYSPCLALRGAVEGWPPTVQSSYLAVISNATAGTHDHDGPSNIKESVEGVANP